jgi:hypothetical protein
MQRLTTHLAFICCCGTKVRMMKEPGVQIRHLLRAPNSTMSRKNLNKALTYVKATSPETQTSQDLKSETNN